jgi:indolepyruvate ferredoxin oxidoreductase
MDRATIGFTQMGGEGVPWVGQQPFSNEKHVFANLGDGTYFHSGLLAIRQAIAAGVNITYKILYNDAVAMTGGQQVGERPEGHSVLQIAHSLSAEGVRKLVVTDQPEKYTSLGRDQDGRSLPPGVEVFHRDELDRIQRELRDVEGCTVIIYDQTCATEKRRRRKRGTMEDPAVRVVINDLVCEGCGDCSVKSNCLSVEPLETEFGRKRTINQSTCNKDTSCLKGFCPSFVTVEGGSLKGKTRAPAPVSLADGPELPQPQVPQPQDAYGIVVAGVGGTGVITIGQLLGMAAHMEGKGIVTQDAAGLAQKGGATWSHVLIAPTQDAIRTTRVGMAGADLVIGCDPIVAAGKETVLRMREGRTRVALNAHGTPTAAFVKNGAWANPSDACAGEIAKAVGESALAAFNAEAAAARLLGDSIYTNPMLLGFAWQKGWVPLARESLLRAFELNGVAVEKNKAAFEWGRRAAHEPAALAKMVAPAQVIELKKRETLQHLVARRVEFLTDYQNATYARRYEEFVERVRSAEAPLGKTALAEAVARNLFKLMAYKDEYEVARLHAETGFREKIAAQFEGDYRIHYHLAPPLLARRDAKGELQKGKYGPATFLAFRVLARLKGLRGTALDVFGRTEERRTERALIEQYRETLEQVLCSLDAGNHALAVAIANVPEQIKGFGHVKERNLAAARMRWDELMRQWAEPAGTRQAA